MELCKVLILGGSGMLGHKLFLHLSKQAHLEVFTTVRSNDLAQYIPNHWQLQ